MGYIWAARSVIIGGQHVLDERRKWEAGEGQVLRMHLIAMFRVRSITTWLSFWMPSQTHLSRSGLVSHYMSSFSSTREGSKRYGCLVLYHNLLSKADFLIVQTNLYISLTIGIHLTTSHDSNAVVDADAIFFSHLMSMLSNWMEGIWQWLVRSTRLNWCWLILWIIQDRSWKMPKIAYSMFDVLREILMAMTM